MWDLGIRTYLSCEEVGHSRYLGAPYSWVVIHAEDLKILYDCMWEGYDTEEDRIRICGKPLWYLSQSSEKKYWVDQKMWFYHMEVEYYEEEYYHTIALFIPRGEVSRVVSVLSSP